MGVKEVAIKNIWRGILRVQKHGPAILTGAGILGFIGTVVVASKATLKLEDTLDEMARDVEDAEGSKALVKAYVSGTYHIAMLYMPAVGLGVASIICLASAQGIMQKRNAALASAYTALDQGFREYRSRVVEKIGKEEERNLYYGVVDTVQKDAETGKDVAVRLVDTNQISQYARFFDETCEPWKKNADYNFVYLQHQQSYFNDLLHLRGHVFLNEVYDALGIPRSSAGAIVGWFLYGDGDNFVDFGLCDPTPEHRMFVNGHERSILLDFNVDGIIYDKIDNL